MWSFPHATRVSDPRAAGLIQVKAVGLVVVSDHKPPHLLSGEPNLVLR